MASGFRRLVADHASLHNSDLPPNYLFAPSNTHSSIPDDLRQLIIFLAGPQGTPYSNGVWRLHLRIPDDYPKSPPKATFKTRIWHPNVEESTGAVCVDTLKRDWEPKLTLRDVLITISCLLIHPNPDSALNSAAGALLQDDYEAFARQARLMTSIHAPVPQEMRDAVSEAKRRGEDPNIIINEDQDTLPPKQSKRESKTSSSTVIMKKRVPSHRPIPGSNLDIRLKSDSFHQENPRVQQEDESDCDDDLSSASKENDPSLSPTPVPITTPSPRKSVLGKRPLAALATPEPVEMVVIDDDDDEEYNGMSASDKNIAANIHRHEHDQIRPQRRKSPKLSELGRGSNSASLQIQPTGRSLSLLESSYTREFGEQAQLSSDGRRASNMFSKPPNNTHGSKENITECPSNIPLLSLPTGNTPLLSDSPKPSLSSSTTFVLPKPQRTGLPKQSKPTITASRKVSSSSAKLRPRTGLRRL